MIYIGLDISTTTIGYSAIVIKDKKITNVYYDYYCPNKKLDSISLIVDAKDKIINAINNIISKHNEDKDIYVCVEDILLQATKTTAMTITKLAGINRTLCVAMKENFGNLKLIYVQTIRAQLKRMAGRTDRVDKESVPDVLQEIVSKHIKDWTFDFELKKIGKKKGEKKIENYDKADGMAVALAGAYLNKEILI